MTYLWEYTDPDRSKAYLEPTPGHAADLYLRANVYLTRPAARSLRDALNTYLEQASTAEAWEVP